MTRNFLTLALFAGVLISCTSTTDPAVAEAESAVAAAKAKGQENVALVEKFIAAFETGETEFLKEICSPDFVTWGPGIDSKSTLEEYMNLIGDLKESVDSMKFHTLAIMPNTVEEGELAGDYVFWWGDQTGYFVEYGKSIRLRLHTVYKIEEGKIAWTSDFWDTGDMKRQLLGEEKKNVKE